MDRFLNTKNGLHIALTVLYAALLFLIALLMLIAFPVARSAEFVVATIQRFQLPILWLTAAGIVSGFLMLNIYRGVLYTKGIAPLVKSLWLWMFLGMYIPLVVYFRDATYASHLKDFEFPLLWLGGFFLFWALINTFVKRDGLETVNKFLTLMGVFLTVFVLYQHLAFWVDWVHKNDFEYWDLLALQFLNGNLYLADSSISNFTTHDLTLHNGKWYVPIPPLPAILMMPVMLFAKPENVFMGDVSMILGAMNAALVYVVLSRLTAWRWISNSPLIIFWLVILFAFGTNHLWVAIVGEVWFVSQVVTVTFLLLAVLAALYRLSPWVVGTLIGTAMFGRPNSMMIWPFVFAIAMQIKKDEGEIVDFGLVFHWSFRSALPIVFAILGLLSYNYLRFEDFMDFGYVTISGDPAIVQNAQTYGIFSPQYIFHNIEVMFLNLPQLRIGDTWIFQPSLEGMSIFLSTPVLFYLFHRYEKKWWILGAWGSIFLSFGLLAMYHNTGSAQFGYRYLLDMIIPLLGLLSTSFQKKIPWHFYILLFLSIVVNIYGTAWFINAN